MQREESHDPLPCKEMHVPPKNICGLGVSLLWQRKIAFRLRLASLDRAGRAVFRKDTEYQVLALRKDQELEVMNLENQDVVFPIYVACNFLYLPREGRCPE